VVGEIVPYSQIGYPANRHESEELIAKEEREF
jgi:hypothetical protein